MSDYVSNEKNYNFPKLKKNYFTTPKKKKLKQNYGRTDLKKKKSDSTSLWSNDFFSL